MHILTDRYVYTLHYSVQTALWIRVGGNANSGGDTLQLDTNVSMYMNVYLVHKYAYMRITRFHRPQMPETF